MKKITTILIKSLIVMAPLSAIAQAPTVAWIKNFGSNHVIDSDQGRSVTTDASGNTYHTGVFSNTSYFDTYSFTASGSDNMFLAKRDANGNILWIQRSAKAAYVHDVAVDASGNIYTTGYSSYYGPNSFGSVSISNIGYEDGFITKSDANGNFIWAKNFGGNSYDTGNAMAIDGSGNIFLTGQFNTKLTIGTQTINSGSGITNAFLAKLDPAGNVIWANAYGGQGTNEGLEVCTDAAGNAYSVGTFSGTATFGTHTLTSTATTAKYNVYVVKTDAAGNTSWATHLATNSGDYYYDGYDYGIAVDGNGNVNVTGCFKGLANFGTYNVTTNTGNAGDTDIFLTQLNASGNVNWVKKYGFNFNDRGGSLACDAAGNIYSTGIYDGTVTFGAHTLSGGGTYVLKHTPTGNVEWAKRIGESGYAYTNDASIAVNTNNEVFLTGNFRYRMIIDNDTLYSASSSDKDGFVLKLNATTIGIKENELENNTHIMPNPASSFVNISIHKQTPTYYTALLIDVFGKTVTEVRSNDSDITFNLEGLNAGVYFIQLYNDKGNKVVRKIVKL